MDPFVALKNDILGIFGVGALAGIIDSAVQIVNIPSQFFDTKSGGYLFNDGIGSICIHPELNSGLQDSGPLTEGHISILHPLNERVAGLLVSVIQPDQRVVELRETLFAF